MKWHNQRAYSRKPHTNIRFVLFVLFVFHFLLPRDSRHFNGCLFFCLLSTYLFGLCNKRDERTVQWEYCSDPMSNRTKKKKQTIETLISFVFVRTQPHFPYSEFFSEWSDLITLTYISRKLWYRNINWEARLIKPFSRTEVRLSNKSKYWM